jgi:ABC-2 type transport system ATP-binding protein
VLIIAEGKLVASGTPEELSRAAGGQGAKVIAKIRGAEAESLLRGHPRVASLSRLSDEDGLVRYEIITRGPGDCAEEIFQLAVANHWSLAELRSEGASLEEIFKRLTAAEGN